LFPCLFGVFMETFGLVVPLLAVCVDGASMVGVDHTVCCCANGFGFQTEAYKVKALEDLACTSHEAVPEDTGVVCGLYLG
jgi:hypothetical protein